MTNLEVKMTNFRSQTVNCFSSNNNAIDSFQPIESFEHEFYLNDIKNLESNLNSQKILSELQLEFNWNSNFSLIFSHNWNCLLHLYIANLQIVIYHLSYRKLISLLSHLCPLYPSAHLKWEEKKETHWWKNSKLFKLFTMLSVNGVDCNCNCNC